jgi:pilus assembly protein CpaB
MNRRLGLIVLAAVLALVGTIAVYSYAHNADKRAVDKTRSTTVLYAARDVPVGTTWKEALDGNFFTEERVPVDAAPSSAIPNLTAAIPDKDVATSRIGAGQIAVRQMFAEKVAKTGVLAIPKGKQALTVNVEADADVAGFVQSGSEIALYGTFELQASAKDKSGTGTFGGPNQSAPKLVITKLIAPRLSVIATSVGAPSDVQGRKSLSDSNSNSSTTTVLVTVAVDQRTAERIILARETGFLYMGLLTSDSVTGPDGGTLNVGIFKPNPIFGPTD